MRARNAEYKKTSLQWRNDHIGWACQDLRCGHVFETSKGMMINHIVPRTHGKGVMCGRDGVRICCSFHPSIEDINPKTGARTTPEERVKALRWRYGEDAVTYYRANLWSKTLDNKLF